MSIRVYNAAGPRSKLPKDLFELLESPVPVITIGSISLKPGTGNNAKKYWIDPESGTSLNSMGLPSKGIEYYESFLPSLLKIAKSRGKLIRVSIAGSNPKEYVELVQRLAKLQVDQIEINVSCPNVWRGGKQKSIPCFNIPLLREIIEKTSLAAGKLKLDFKVSPYSDPNQLQEVARLLSRSKSIRAVVCSNTFPNAYSDTTGLGGLGGSALRFISLGQVKQFRDLLPKRILVVGVGGVSAKSHVREYARAGAAEVQVGTYYFENGVQVFKRLR